MMKKKRRLTHNDDCTFDILPLSQVPTAPVSPFPTSPQFSKISPIPQNALYLPSPFPNHPASLFSPITCTHMHHLLILRCISHIDQLQLTNLPILTNLFYVTSYMLPISQFLVPDTNSLFLFPVPISKFLTLTLHRVEHHDQQEDTSHVRCLSAVLFCAPKMVDTSLEPVVRPGEVRKYISGVKVGQLRGQMARKWQKREGTLTKEAYILEEAEIMATPHLQTQDDVIERTVKAQ